MRARAGAFAALLAVVACAAPAPTDRFADTGVTLAHNVGSTLVILSLDPARPGRNDVRVERAMNALRSVRESQTLTSGFVTFGFTYTEVAPDRLKISWVTQEGRAHETVIVGTRRFDRDAGSGSA